MLDGSDYDEDTGYTYWPFPDGQQIYDPFLVNLVSVSEKTHWTIRTMTLTNAQRPNDPPRVVRQFQFEFWRMDKKTPANRKRFIQLMEKVDGWRDRWAESEQRRLPVVIHCCDGGSRSGLFAACYVVCEKMRTEGEVDIFHTVKSMKRRKYNVVNCLVSLSLK